MWWGLAIVGYYCWFQTFYNVVRFYTPLPYNDLPGMLWGIAYNFPPILLIFVWNLVVVFRLVRMGNLKLKMLTDGLLSAVGLVAVNVGFLKITGMDAHVDWAGAVLNDVIILMIAEVVYYFQNLSRSIKETEEARLVATQYRYDALKAQINPHFLFNSLNLLYSLVSVDAAKAKEFIGELSRMYRYIMAQHGQESVSVSEEFSFLASYAAVLNMRYGQKFSVNIVGTPAPGKLIIPFTMQLLLENVTKHNAITAHTPMQVSIVITDEEITIANPIRPKETQQASHFGLQYLKQLYMAHGKCFHVERTPDTFTAHIPYL